MRHAKQGESMPLAITLLVVALLVAAIALALVAIAAIPWAALVPLLDIPGLIRTFLALDALGLGAG